MFLNTIIISHGEDIDGIVSAAYIKSHLFDQGLGNNEIATYLVDYPGYAELLKDIVVAGDIIERLYIADLGLNSITIPIIMNMTELSKSSTDLYRYYFDHHMIPETAFNLIYELRKRFTGYENTSCIESTENNVCTSEILFNKFNYAGNELFELLQKYAHCSDFHHSEERINDTCFEQLKRYIAFNQSNKNKLLELCDCMVSTEAWNAMKFQIAVDAKEINDWFTREYNYVKTSICCLTSEGFDFVLGCGQLKAEEINNYIFELMPENDLYVGVCLTSYYVNILSRYPVANRIAEIYGGGGHVDRSGFKLPADMIGRIKNGIDHDYDWKHKLLGEVSSRFIKLVK